MSGHCCLSVQIETGGTRTLSPSNSGGSLEQQLQGGQAARLALAAGQLPSPQMPLASLIAVSIDHLSVTLLFQGLQWVAQPLSSFARSAAASARRACLSLACTRHHWPLELAHSVCSLQVPLVRGFLVPRGALGLPLGSPSLWPAPTRRRRCAAATWCRWARPYTVGARLPLPGGAAASGAATAAGPAAAVL